MRRRGSTRDAEYRVSAVTMRSKGGVRRAVPSSSFDNVGLEMAEVEDDIVASSFHVHLSGKTVQSRIRTCMEPLPTGS